MAFSPPFLGDKLCEAVDFAAPKSHHERLCARCDDRHTKCDQYHTWCPARSAVSVRALGGAVRLEAAQPFRSAAKTVSRVIARSLAIPCGALQLRGERRRGQTNTD